MEQAYNVKLILFLWDMLEDNTGYVVVQARYLSRLISYWSGPELAQRNVVVAPSDQSSSRTRFFT